MNQSITEFGKYNMAPTVNEKLTDLRYSVE